MYTSFMSRTTTPIILSPQEQSTLEAWARGRTYPLRLVQRAQIIKMAADGNQSQDIARDRGISRPTVQLWRQRFLALRMGGLEKDAPRPGRIPKIPEEKIQAVVEATLHSTPCHATHWSTRSMAKAQGLSAATIRRIWKQYNLKPHLIKTFKLSRDKHFIEKLHDVVGLYLNPPDKSVVFCVDEKSQIQALDRTQPGLPMKPGRCGTMTHDYKRNGTTTLFAALSMLDGRVIGDCMPRHRHQEFIKFLNAVERAVPAGKIIHAIADNYATHKHPKVIEWLADHPRWVFHFIPTSASWLNAVEGFFSTITRRKIRRGAFKSVPDLEAEIARYIKEHNKSPKPFVWTKPAKAIFDKLAAIPEPSV